MKQKELITLKEKDKEMVANLSQHVVKILVVESSKLSPALEVFEIFDENILGHFKIQDQKLLRS